jgi:integrase/recombinase XerD
VFRKIPVNLFPDFAAALICGVNLTFRRIQRAKLTRPKQAKGLMRASLDRVLDVQPDNPWGLRNRAMLSLGYEILARRSELLALMTDDLEFLNDGTSRVIIRRSKADPYGKGRVAFTSNATSKFACDWLARRGPDISYLFCPIYQGKVVDRDLSTTSVKRLVKSAAKAAGLEQGVIDAFSGHSFLVGAVQDLLCAGYDAAAIMLAGGLEVGECSATVFGDG